MSDQNSHTDEGERLFGGLEITHIISNTYSVCILMGKINATSFESSETQPIQR